MPGAKSDLPACDLPGLLADVVDLLSKMTALIAMVLPGAGGPAGPTKPTSNPSGPAAPPEFQKFPEVPAVGTEPEWGLAHMVVNSRLLGSPEARRAIHDEGRNPWTGADGRMTGQATDAPTRERIAVWRVLQETDDVLFDADRRMFVARATTGQTRDVASLGEVMARQPAVLDQNRMDSVAPFLAGRVEAARAAGPIA